MKTITTTLEGMSDQPVPQWIEAKVSHYLMNRCFELLTFVTLYGWNGKYISYCIWSHVQTRGYECGYYVMRWMW